MNTLVACAAPAADVAPFELLYAADRDGQSEILLLLTPPGGAR